MSDNDEEEEQKLDRNYNIIRKKLKVLPVPPKGTTKTKNASIDNSLKNLSVKKAYKPTCASYSSPKKQARKYNTKNIENAIIDPVSMHAEYNSSNNAREEQDTGSEKQCNLCTVIYELQRESIRLSVEQNLRLQNCEKMLRDITDKINNHNSLVSDVINNDPGDLEH